MISIIKYFRNDFYYKNPLEMISIIEMYKKCFFYNKNGLKMISIIRIYQKWFLQ